MNRGNPRVRGGVESSRERYATESSRCNYRENCMAIWSLPNHPGRLSPGQTDRKYPEVDENALLFKREYSHQILETAPTQAGEPCKIRQEQREPHHKVWTSSMEPMEYCHSAWHDREPRVVLGATALVAFDSAQSALASDDNRRYECKEDNE